MKKYILPVFITLFTIIIVVKYIPFSQIPYIPTMIAPLGILIGLVLYLLSYMLIAARWKILFGEGQKRKYPFSPILLLLITGSHQFYANFLPARTGDLTILYLAKKHLNIESPRGMTSLIIARSLDIVVLGMLSISFMAWQHQNIKLLNASSIIFVLCLIGLPVLGILSVILWGGKIASWLEHPVGHYLTARGWMELNRLFRFLSETMKTLHERKSWIFYMKCLGLSILLIVVRVCLFSAFILHSRHPVPLTAAPLIGLCTLLAALIPLQGFLGLGTFEAGWVLGYVLAGLSPEEGLITAVNAHLLIIVFIVSVGSLSNFILLKTRSTLGACP